MSLYLHIVAQVESAPSGWAISNSSRDAPCVRPIEPSQRVDHIPTRVF